MRRILIDHARRKATSKRGGQLERVDLIPVADGAEPQQIDWLALDEALKKLEQHDAQKALIVKLRFFAGLSLEQ